MNLIIDQGNSFIKFYLFDFDKITKFFVYPTNKVDYFFLEKLEPENILYSTVYQIDKKIIKIFGQKNFILFDFEKLKLPVVNNYKSKTLGKDRLAAIIGAKSIFPKNNVLSIDMGTAITFDFATKTGVYLGGNISPGMNMRFKALNTFTANLPLVKPKDKNILLADNTDDAILAGVINGIVFEIETYIEKLEEKYSDMKVFLTGGDANLFVKKIKKTIFAKQNLVAIGLNEVLKLNV